MPFEMNAIEIRADDGKDDRLSASDVHAAVSYSPITRYDVAGYLNPDGLTAVADSLVADSLKEEQP